MVIICLPISSTTKLTSLELKDLNRVKEDRVRVVCHQNEIKPKIA